MASPSLPRRRPRPELVTFGQHVRNLREARAWTQAELAEHSELDTSYISQLERGLRDPSLTSLRALARALGLPVHRFLEMEPSPRPSSVSSLDALSTALEALSESRRQEVVDVLRRICRLALPG